MMHNIIIPMGNVINTLSLYIVLEDGLLVQILFVSMQQDPIRAGIFLLILMDDEEYANYPCHFY